MAALKHFEKNFHDTKSTNFRAMRGGKFGNETEIRPCTNRSVVRSLKRQEHVKIRQQAQQSIANGLEEYSSPTGNPETFDALFKLAAQINQKLVPMYRKQAQEEAADLFQKFPLLFGSKEISQGEQESYIYNDLLILGIECIVNDALEIALGHRDVAYQILMKELNKSETSETLVYQYQEDENNPLGTFSHHYPKSHDVYGRNRIQRVSLDELETQKMNHFDDEDITVDFNSDDFEHFDLLTDAWDSQNFNSVHRTIDGIRHI